MKKLICTVLCLTLLCCAALPAAAELPDPLTEAQVVEQLKQAGIEDPIVPRITLEGVVLAFGELSVTEDGSYILAQPTKVDAPLDIVSVSLVTAENTDARLSPYQGFLRQAALEDTLAVSANAVKDLVAKETQYQWENDTENHYFQWDFACVPADALANPTLDVVYWRTMQRKQSADQPVPHQQHELVVRVSDKYLLSVQYRVLSPISPTITAKDQWLNYLAPHISITTTGDADLNGQVNAVDGLLTLKHAVQKAEIADELAFALADWNDDGTLDAGDALHTLQKAVGKAR